MQSAMNKAEFRKEMLARSDALSERERRENDKKIHERVMSLSEYARAERVFVYVGVGTEISTDEIIDRLLSGGKSVYVPLCRGCGEMDAIKITSRKDLKPGRYGIPEPSSANPKTVPEKLDLIIVPGVAFGEDGTRIGRGGGYYDRFLAKAKNAIKIALCREVNMEKTVPHEVHDEKADIIVTDMRVIKIIR